MLALELVEGLVIPVPHLSPKFGRQFPTREGGYPPRHVNNLLLLTGYFKPEKEEWYFKWVSIKKSV